MNLPLLNNIVYHDISMEINLEINDATNSPVEAGFFEKIAEKTLAETEVSFLENSKIGISLAIVAPEEIKKLNKQYRKSDNVTDILSFSEYKNLEDIRGKSLKKKEELFLGELILCYDDIKEYTAKEKLNLDKELSKVFAHGILHLLGFNHGNEMFDIQNKIINKNFN